MSGRTLILLLATSLLGACWAASIILLRVDERTRRMLARREMVLGAYQATSAAISGNAALSVTMPTKRISIRAQQMLGMDPVRPSPYPLSPWLILPAAMLPALAARWLFEGLLGSLAWGILPVVWLVLVRNFYRGSDTKRRVTLLKQFPDALGTIVRAVRVGIPVKEAIRAVSRDAAEPTAGEFARVYDQVAIGTTLEAALREMAARNQLSEYRFFATTMSLQGQTGGGLSETLENLADVIRRRVALKAKGYALAAEARTSAGVLAALPVLTGLALALMNPGYIAPLMQDGPGRSLFGFAVIWLGLGIVVMRGLIRKSLS